MQISTTKSLQLFQVLRQVALILISIFLAKSTLSAAEIGVYELMMYLGTFLTFFTVNGLLQAMSPIFVKLAPRERKVFIFNTFIVFLGLAAVLFLVLGLGKSVVIPLLTGQADLPFFDIFLLFLVFNLTSFPVEYFYLLHKKPWAIVAWGVASFGLQIAAVVAPLWLGFGLRGSLWALTGLAFAKFLWTLGLTFQLGLPEIRRDFIKKYLVLAWPLMITSLVGSFVVMFDNWLVGWYFSDPATFAIYRFGARELPLAQALATALGVSLVPSLVQNLPEGLKMMKNMSRKLFHLLFPLAIALMFLAKPFFPLVFSLDFAASAPLFCICLMLTASRVLLPNAILISMEKTPEVLRVSLAELFLKVILGVVFIQIWGLPGVIWSAVAAFFFEKIALIWILERKFKVKTGDWLDLRWYFGYFGLLVLAYFFSNFNLFER